MSGEHIGNIPEHSILNRATHCTETQPMAGSEQDGAHLPDDPIEMQTFGPLKGRAAGLKFDADKPRMELLIQGMPRALEAVGVVLTFGAQKYEAHSWQHVEDNHNRYWAAKTRHELARAKGEERDPETGLLHLAHEACNALFLLELALMEMEQ